MNPPSEKLKGGQFSSTFVLYFTISGHMKSDLIRGGLLYLYRIIIYS